MSENNYNKIEKRIQQHIQKEILQNPFFTKLKEGTLSKKQLQFAMGQYYHFRNHFHQWFGIAIYNTVEVSHWKSCVENLMTEAGIDEKFGAKNHREYFEDFLKALSATPQEPTKQTKEQINWFCERFKKGNNPIGVLAALGPGNELATDQRLHLMYEALKTHYHLPEEALQFFRVHIDGVEEDHYEAIKKALIPYAKEHAHEIEKEAKNAITQSAAFWRALAS